MTSIVTVAVSLPPALVAVIVYVVEDVMVVGVPLISPFDVSNVRPDGRVGEIAQVTTVPPPEVGEAVDIAVPFVRVYVLGEYAITGAASLTTMVIVAVSLPPVFDAVTV